MHSTWLAGHDKGRKTCLQDASEPTLWHRCQGHTGFHCPRCRTLRAEAEGDERPRLHRRAHAVPLLPVPLRRVALLLVPVPLLTVTLLLLPPVPPVLLPVRILAVLQVGAIHDHRARTRLLLLLLLWLLLLRVEMYGTSASCITLSLGTQVNEACKPCRRRVADHGATATTTATRITLLAWKTTVLWADAAGRADVSQRDDMMRASAAADLGEAAGRGAEGGVLPKGVVAARRLGLELPGRPRAAILRRRRGLLLRQQLRRGRRRRLDLPAQTGFRSLLTSANAAIAGLLPCSGLGLSLQDIEWHP